MPHSAAPRRLRILEACSQGMGGSGMLRSTTSQLPLNCCYSDAEERSQLPDYNCSSCRGERGQLSPRAALWRPPGSPDDEDKPRSTDMQGDTVQPQREGRPAGGRRGGAGSRSLGEASPSQDDQHCGSRVPEGPRAVTFTEAESPMVSAEGWGGPTGAAVQWT